MREYLARQSLPNVHVGLDKQPPLSDLRSGKLREVIVANQTPHEHGAPELPANAEHGMRGR